MQEGEQADTSQQGGKAPKNPITGEPLTPVQNKDKEGYQATVLAGQSEDTSARIMKQLDGQDGRPFGGGLLRTCWCTVIRVLAGFAFHRKRDFGHAIHQPQCWMTGHCLRVLHHIMPAFLHIQLSGALHSPLASLIQ
jgi:hypothetical protein